MNIKTHPLLEKAIQRFMADPALGELRFWGHFGLYLNYAHDESIGTCAVTARAGKLTFLYCKKFLEEELKTEEEVMFLYLHEIMHLIAGHQARNIGSQLEPRLANIAADAVINEGIIADSALKQIAHFPQLGGVRMPKEYTDAHIMETVYHWLKDNAKEIKISFGDGKGGTKESEGLPGETGETMDKHMEVSQQEAELAKVLAGEITEGLKARGLVSASIQRQLDGLVTTPTNYLKEVKKVAALMKGLSSKMKTIKRLNRRGTFGVKGKIKQAQAIVAVLDTSGSMWGMFEEALSVINREGLEIHLIHCDTEIKKIDFIQSKKDLAKVQINGGGGTILQPGIDHACENFPGLPVVVLTDGYCDSLDFSKASSMSLVLSTATDVKIIGGLAKVILIDKKR